MIPPCKSRAQRNRYEDPEPSGPAVKSRRPTESVELPIFIAESELPILSAGSDS